MRRQTTKEPRGPATRARARPASKALSRKSGMLAAISMDMGLHLTLDAQAAGGRLVDHRAVQVVFVVVAVMVDRQGLGILAEQLDEGRVAADLLRVAGAADVAIQADHKSEENTS